MTLAIILLSLISWLSAASIDIVPPKSGFGVPTYLKKCTFSMNFIVPIFLALLIFIISYPKKEYSKYQCWLISVMGVTLGAAHILGSEDPNFFSRAMENLSWIIVPVMFIVSSIISMRPEFRSLTMSLANTYFGGYLVLMFFSIEFQPLGLLILGIAGLFNYFFLSHIRPIFIAYSKGSISTFFFLGILYCAPPSYDTFTARLDYTSANVNKSIGIFVLISSGIFFYIVWPFIIKTVFNKLIGHSEDSGAYEKPAAIKQTEEKADPTQETV